MIQSTPILSKSAYSLNSLSNSRSIVGLNSSPDFGKMAAILNFGHHISPYVALSFSAYQETYKTTPRLSKSANSVDFYTQKVLFGGHLKKMAAILEFRLSKCFFLKSVP